VKNANFSAMKSPAFLRWYFKSKRLLPDPAEYATAVGPPLAAATRRFTATGS